MGTQGVDHHVPCPLKKLLVHANLLLPDVLAVQDLQMDGVWTSARQWEGVRLADLFAARVEYELPNDFIGVGVVLRQQLRA